MAKSVSEFWTSFRTTLPTFRRRNFFLVLFFSHFSFLNTFIRLFSTFLLCSIHFNPSVLWRTASRSLFIRCELFHLNRVLKELSRFSFFLLYVFLFKSTKKNEKPNKPKNLSPKKIRRLEQQFSFASALLLFQVNQVLAKDWVENCLSYFENTAVHFPFAVSVLSCCCCFFLLFGWK